MYVAPIFNQESETLDHFKCSLELVQTVTVQELLSVYEDSKKTSRLAININCTIANVQVRDHWQPLACIKKDFCIVGCNMKF